jgi:hypothetical protein
MQMQVVGIGDKGTLAGSELTPAILTNVKNPRVAAVVVSDPQDVQIVRSCLRTELPSFLLVNDEGLTELLKRDAKISLLGQIDSDLILNRHRTPRGVRGWLLFFCFLLVIGSPATFVYQTSELARLGFWREPTVWGVLFYVGYLGLAAFSVTAGVFLLRQNRSAVSVAKFFLTTVAVFTMSFYLWVMLRSWSSQTLDSIEDLGRDILLGPTIFATCWGFYLSRSRRVRNTFPPSSKSAR